jgi:drug/metabolite transporter (DMT)-like permease
LESIAIVLVTWAFIGFRFSLSWPTLLIGVLNASGAVWLQHLVDESQHQRLLRLYERNDACPRHFGANGLFSLFRHLPQLVAKEKAATLKSFKLNKKSLFWLILCLASAALAINCLVLVVGIVENTAILYTIENGGVLIVSALYSIFLFKEKPTVAKICGILLAAASMVVLSLP